MESIELCFLYRNPIDFVEYANIFVYFKYDFDLTSTHSHRIQSLIVYIGVERERMNSSMIKLVVVIPLHRSYVCVISFFRHFITMSCTDRLVELCRGINKERMVLTAIPSFFSSSF